MSEKHVHKYRRHTYKSGNSVYFCALPDCSNKIATSLALGKRTICWRCGESFIMTEYSIRLAKPHCQNCHKIKLPSEVIEEQDKINELNSMIVETMPSIPHRDSLSDLRNRLSGVHGIQGKPDDEGDI